MSRKPTASGPTAIPVLMRRCAIYTRKSTDENLDRQFNTLDAQRDSCEAYILSQRSVGWVLVADHYDDGGFTGANLERPALRRGPTLRWSKHLPSFSLEADA
jgi:hypothetical protein